MPMTNKQVSSDDTLPTAVSTVRKVETVNLTGKSNLEVGVKDRRALLAQMMSKKHYRQPGHNNALDDIVNTKVVNNDASIYYN